MKSLQELYKEIIADEELTLIITHLSPKINFQNGNKRTPLSHIPGLPLPQDLLIKIFLFLRRESIDIYNFL